MQRLSHASAVLDAEIWIKRDDLTNPVHGGNKVRKLQGLLAEARRRGATDILTVGAAGSNHVLSTALHAGSMGLSVTAFLLPHPYSRFAHHKTAATLAAHARLVPVRNPWAMVTQLRLEFVALRKQGRRPLIIPAGGTGRIGTRAYAAAAAELAEQVADCAIPDWPTAVVVALGSGGTAAGLWAGLSAALAPVSLHAVRVVSHRFVGRAFLRWLAARAGGPSLPRRGLVVVQDQLGKGYGYPTEAGLKAQQLFAEDGIQLDDTYTAKAAAALVALARKTEAKGPLLFWHTLSAAHPFNLDDEPAPLPMRIAQLLR